MLKTAIKYR